MFQVLTSIERSNPFKGLTDDLFACYPFPSLPVIFEILVVPHPVMHLSMSFTVKNAFYELEMKEGIYMTRQTLFRDIFDGLEDILETRHDA